MNNIEKHRNDVKKLRDLYIADLSKIVNFGGGDRPRVRHPGNWERQDTQIYLNQKHSDYIDASTLYEKENVWIWSDLHFSHKNIIRFSDRPFENTEQMNEHLIANHNEYVQPNDISIWVGDVGFGNDGHINSFVDQCHGYKILVIGNHDFTKRKVRKLHFDEIHLVYILPTPEGNMALTHYPLASIEKPWFNLHGHLHMYPNPITGNPLHINVNCELQDYRPKKIEEIVNVVKLRKEELYNE